MYSLRDRLAVVAVAGDDVVGLAESGDSADADGLLADIQMAEAADMPLLIHLARLFLKPADQNHLPVKLYLNFSVQNRLSSRLNARYSGYSSLL